MISVMNIKNEQEMQGFAKSFIEVRQLADDPSPAKAVVIALHGDLGAGKSTFVRAVARELGIEEHVTSPTFNILKTYGNLVHIDAYRLEDEKDLEVLGWEELLNNPKNLIFIEWPKNIKSALPKNTKHLYFEYVDESTRSVK